MTEAYETPDRIEVWALAWPEVGPGDDLAVLVVASVGEKPLLDGDVLILTSKVVSKAEGSMREGPRTDVVDAESVRVVARRGPTVIAETRHGLVLAAAGVDESNIPDGRSLTLPADPDGVARRLRAELAAQIDVNVAVVVTDTAGRAWRNGQTDMAIGCAGLEPVLDLRGRRDTVGRPLTVTTPAVADELAATGDLVKGKVAGRPVAVVRGLAGLVLPRGQDGPGAGALVRDPGEDLFGLGTREAAVAAAVRDDGAALERFPRLVAGDEAPFERLIADHSDISVEVTRTATGWSVRICVTEGAHEDALIEAGRFVERAAALAAAHRLAAGPAVDMRRPARGWRAVHSATWVVA